MAVRLGDEDTLAVEVGEWAGPELRRVDLWAAGQWLTCDDNLVYVKQFRRAVAGTADWVRSGRAEPSPFPETSAAATHRLLLAGIRGLDDDYRRFRPFDCWGPTIDNVVAFLFRDGDRLALTCEFWREEHVRRHPEHAGTVLVAQLSERELTGTLDRLVELLEQGGDAREGRAGGSVGG